MPSKSLAHRDGRARFPPPEQPAPPQSLFTIVYKAATQEARAMTHKERVAEIDRLATTLEALLRVKDEEERAQTQAQEQAQGQAQG